MPNDNLGVAHGRIKISVDDRGTAEATAALIRLQAQFDRMNTHLAKIEKGLTKSDASFKKVKVSTEKAAKTSRTLTVASWAMDKALDAVGRDFATVAKNLQTFNKYASVTKHRLGQLKMATGFFQALGGYNKNMNYFNASMRVTSNLLMKLTKGSKDTNRWFTAWTRGNTILGRSLTGLSSNISENTEAWMKWRSVLLSGALAGKAISNQLIGVDKLVKDSPDWVRKLFKVNKALIRLGGAATALSVALIPLTKLQRFANSKVFQTLGRGIVGLGVRFNSFGRIIGKAFGPNAYRPFALFSKKIKGFGNDFSNVLDVSSRGFGRFRKGLNSVLRPYRSIMTSLSKLTLGFAMAGSGFNNLLESVQWFFKIPKPLMAAFALFFSRVLPDAIGATGRFFERVSDLVAGLWDGIKVLLRGAVALPGLLAGIGAAVSGWKVAFSGVGKALSDLFDNNPQAAFEAYITLPQHLKPLGRAILDIVPKWKKLQKALQTTAFKGVEKQIANLARVYFPLFEKSAKKVVDAFVNIRNAAYEFAMQSKTRVDFAAIYSGTAVALQNLAKSTKPAAEGFRDMAVEGLKFFKEASSWAPYMSNKFAEWAKLNRENGRLMRWMQDARDGVYDLSKGLGEATEGLYGILTMFKTKSNDNFLERFNASMKNFETKVLESSISGLGAKFRDFYRAVGSENIDKLKELFAILGKVIADTSPLIKNLSDSFSSMFVPSVDAAVTVIGKIQDALDALGLDTMAGVILGLVASVKLMPNVLKQVWSAIKVVWGAFLVWRSGAALISGISTTLIALYSHLSEGKGRFSQWSAALVEKLENIVSAGGKTVKILARITSVIGIAAAGVWMMLSAQSAAKEKLEDFNDQLKENEKNIREYGQRLGKAFAKDAGITGDNVIDATKDSLIELEQQMETTGKKAPGWLDNVWSWLTTAGKDQTGFMGSSKEFNDMQESANQAKLAAQGFAKLREEKVDLNALLVSSDEYYQTEIKNLRKTGDAGNAAADQLDNLRRQYVQNRQDAERMGESGLLLNESLEKVATSGANSAKALDGLRGTLTALGILQVDAAEAAMDWYDALNELPAKVAEIAAETGNFGNAALVVNGQVNAAVPGVSALAKELISAGKAYQTQAAALGSAEQPYAEFMTQLDSLAASSGRSKEEILELARVLGFEKEWTNLTLQIKNKDDLTQDIFEVFAAAKEAAATGISVPIKPDVAKGDLQKTINDAVGREVVTTEGNNLLKISPDLNPQELDKILTLLSSKGVEIPGFTKASEPLKMPIVPEIVAQNPSDKGGLGAFYGEIIENIHGEGTGKGDSGDDPFAEHLKDLEEQVANSAKVAEDGGEAFSNNFAEGVRKGKKEVTEAVGEVLEQARVQAQHGSPPKKGPLSGRGWSGYGGRAFSSNFAEGILSRKNDVASAASTVMGAAGNNLKGDKAYEAGQFLGQLSQLNQFFANVVTAFGAVADSFFQIAKFASDPLGKGTFFGRRRGFQRDPNISDEMLAARRADDAQQRRFDFWNSGQYKVPDLDQYGMPRVESPTGLNRESSGTEIQGAIVAEGQRRGFTKEQITAALAIARQESNYGVDKVGVGEGAFLPGGGKGNAYGVFQQTPEGGWGNVEQLLDPNYAIPKFFDAFGQTLAKVADPVTAAILTQNPQLKDKALSDAYGQKTQSLLKEAAGDLANVLKTGATTQSRSGLIIPGMGGVLGSMPRTSRLVDDPNIPVPSQPSSVAAANAVISLFGDQIRGNIGGTGPRPNAPNTHQAGLAIDIPIGEDQMALGDIISDFFLQNAEQFNVRYTIWRDEGRYANNPGQVTFRSAGHYNHIDVQFNDGSTGTIGPGGANIRLPYGNPAASTFPDASKYGPPPTPDDWDQWKNEKTIPEQPVMVGPDGAFIPVHGDGADAGPEIPWNILTNEPWTEEDSRKYYEDPEYQKRYDASILQPGDSNIPGLYLGSQDQMIQELAAQTPILRDILDSNFQNITEDQAISTALSLQNQSDALKEMNTPASRAQAATLDTAIGNLTGEFGLAEMANPIDTASQIGDSVVGIASDIFAVIGSAIETIGTTKEFADTLVRGVANTEDLYNIVDHIQQFIKFGADVAGAASSITSAMATIVGASSAASGGGDMGGGMAAATALQGISAISSFIQSGLEAFNAVVDLGQEAYRIIGSYVGDFLGYLTGGAAGQLAGNVKFLLDEKTNELLAYSVDNPGDKRSHNLPFQNTNPDARNQQIGTINVYGGPGQDPRDNTRQMMFQVKAAQFAAPTGQ